MSVRGLMPSDFRTPRSRKLFSGKTSWERCGCSLYISAQKNLSLLEEEYHPEVNYSLNKRGRWKLLKAVNFDPESVFDHDNCPDQVQIAVVNRPKFRFDYYCSQDRNASQHFYYRDPAGTTEVKDGPGRRHKFINTQSMMAVKHKGNRFGDEAAEVWFASNSVELRRKTPDEEREGRSHRMTNSKSKRRMKLTDYVKYMAEDYSDDEDMYQEQEEEEEKEEDQLSDSLGNYECAASTRSHSVVSHDFEIISEIDDLPDFEVLEDSVIFEFQDKVHIHAQIVHLPEIILSYEYLKYEYGDKLMTAPGPSNICVIDISHAVGNQIIRQKSSKRLHVQAYVVLEKIGDDICVRLNCHVNSDLVSDVYPPSLEYAKTIADIIDECILHCINVYLSVLVITEREYVTEISGYLTPLDPLLQHTLSESVVPSDDLQPASTDQVLPQDSVCGICFDQLESGHFSALASCLHAFCETCWTQHLLSQVQAGRHILRCPAVGCDSRVDDVTKLRHLSANLLYIHRRNIFSAAVESHRDAVWCPNSSCSRPIHLVDLSLHRETSSLPLNIWCPCGAFFCPDCRQEAHWPASCDVYNAYVMDLRERGDWKPNWNLMDHTVIRIFTKPCPECGFQWEKNGGCNHMTCGVCSTSYCWDCGVAREGHHNCFPCDGQPACLEALQAVEHAILPEFSAQHLRLMAAAAAVPSLKVRYFRLLRRAIASDHFDAETTIIPLLRALSECAQASQFAKVAATSEEANELKEVYNNYSKRFEDLTVGALRALSSLNAAEVPKLRNEALTRLRDCQVKGHDTALELNAILAASR